MMADGASQSAGWQRDAARSGHGALHKRARPPASDVPEELQSWVTQDGTAGTGKDAVRTSRTNLGGLLLDFPARSSMRGDLPLAPGRARWSE